MNQYCENNLYLIIEADIYTGSFSFNVIELINYMETGDSGNYDTFFGVNVGGNNFGQLNLPNVLGVNTEEYGISNKNDLLSIIVSQNNLSIDAIPDIGLGDANSEIYWSESPGGNASELSNTQLMEFINLCTNPPEEEEDPCAEYGNSFVQGCADPKALNYNQCAASCYLFVGNSNPLFYECCEYGNDSIEIDPVPDKTIPDKIIPGKGPIKPPIKIPNKLVERLQKLAGIKRLG